MTEPTDREAAREAVLEAAQAMEAAALALNEWRAEQDLRFEKLERQVAVMVQPAEAETVAETISLMTDRLDALEGVDREMARELDVRFKALEDEMMRQDTRLKALEKADG